MWSAIEAYQKIADFEPNPMQETMYNQIVSNNPALLLKSPTGSGKTEAVLFPSLVCGRRLFLIFPSRSLVEDQVGRCEEYLKKMSVLEPDTPYALVIDTGGQAARTVFSNGKRLPEGRRHLYDGDVIITTLDKFLYRFFGFGEPKKSYIFPFRIHYSKTPNLFCFDEVHTYDGVAFTNFVRLIKALYKANLDLTVMTATMPADYQRELARFLDVLNYVETEHHTYKAWYERTKKRSYPPVKQLEHIDASRKQIRDAICAYIPSKYQTGKRIIATIETVEDAVSVYQLMKERYSFENLLLYHGRLSDQQRRKVYRRLKEIENGGGGYLLVTTSAIEVGCDLNAHLLITELCNPDGLIQRAGRCNRKGDIEDAKIVVVGNKIAPFLRTISQSNQENYVLQLQQMSENGSPFDANSLLTFMKHTPHHDYRAEMLFDMLYEYVYEARLENKPLHDRGLVVTRSFEPSVTLMTNLPDAVNHPPENAVSVSLRQCIGSADNDEINSNLVVYQRYFDPYHDEFKFEPLQRGGCVYFKDLFIHVSGGGDEYCDELGYIKPPIVFESRGASGYQHRFVYRTKERDVWLHYLKDLEESTEEESAD